MNEKRPLWVSRKFWITVLIAFVGPVVLTYFPNVEPYLETIFTAAFLFGGMLIAALWTEDLGIREWLLQRGGGPVVRQVDSVIGEFEADELIEFLRPELEKIATELLTKATREAIK